MMAGSYVMGHGIHFLYQKMNSLVAYQLTTVASKQWCHLVIFAEVLLPSIQMVLYTWVVCQVGQQCLVHYTMHYVAIYAASIRSRFNLMGDSFRGCLSNLYIDPDGRKPQSLPFSQALQHENVQFDTCSSY